MPESTLQLITIRQGPEWREFIRDVPDARLWPIGTVKVGASHEGALVLDMNSQKYMLIDKDGTYFDLDQAQVKAALEKAP